MKSKPALADDRSSAAAVPVFLSAAAGILQSARELIRSSAAPRVAVAFWGNGAVAELALARCPPGTRVIVNAQTGGTNPTELEKLRSVLDKRGAQLRTLSSLHAKVVIGSGSMLVGSANFSANGLGYEGSLASCWMEACVTVAEAQAVSAAEQWFDALWRSPRCVRVTDDIIALARERWRPRHRRPQPDPGGDQSRFPTRDELLGVQCFVVVTDVDASEDAEDAAKEEGIVRKIPTPHFFEDWPDLPREALLVAFDAESKNRLSPETFGGAWISAAAPDDVPVNESGSIQLIWPASPSVLRDWRIVRPKALLTSVRALIDHLEGAPAAVRWLKRHPHDLVQYACPTDWCVQLGVFLEALERYGIAPPVANNERKRVK